MNDQSESNAESQVLPEKTAIKTVSAGRGLDWVVDAFKLFWKNPGVWVGAFIVFCVISIVLLLVPLLGHIVVILLGPVFMAGFIKGAQTQEQGDAFLFEHLFYGFNTKYFTQLLLIGLLSLVLMGVAGLIVGLMFASVFALIGWEMVSHLSSPLAAAGVLAQITMPLLVLLLLMMPITMMIWFAPALSVLRGAKAIDAMIMSFKGCALNVLPFTVYGLVVLILSFLATIPLALGYLILMPVVIASIYTAFQDIYSD